MSRDHHEIDEWCERVDTMIADMELRDAVAKAVIHGTLTPAEATQCVADYERVMPLDHQTTEYRADET